MAGMFCPRMFVATSSAYWALLAATSAGATVIARPASKAAAAAMACAAATAEDSAVPVNQATRGCAAAAIDSEAGPNHGSALSRVTIDSKQDAAVLSSTAMPFHAAAAATSPAAPAPA